MSVCVYTFLFYVSVMFFFFFLAVLCSMWDPSSPTRDGTQPPALEAQCLNHWIARGTPWIIFLCTLGCVQGCLLFYPLVFDSFISAVKF